MREILFRGKTREGEWRYGNLYLDFKNALPYDTTYISRDGEIYMVSEKTVGQYVGLKDIYGDKVDVWEHDIIISEPEIKGKGVVKYSHGYFSANGWHLDELTAIKVIGNLTDNPELLRGDE